ncbi:MAG TPA: hypothetical protein VN515_02805 [Terriglobales bacterium]|nr:hypothetical protein [Terriglobales bacterium]
MALDTELATFERMKTALLENHTGKFALIRGQEFIGAFDSAENAYKEGIRRFGRSEFLVRLISPTPEVYSNPALHLGLIRHADF